MLILFQGDVPWWKSNFFISQPVLFGTWDGVFTSCLLNIFGVIVFLRTGWIVGQAGLVNGVLIIIFTGLYKVIFSISSCIFHSKVNVFQSFIILFFITNIYNKIILLLLKIKKKQNAIHFLKILRFKPNINLYMLKKKFGSIINNNNNIK